MTPREYTLHMIAWTRRRQQQEEASQRLAYNTAALMGASMAGKLKPYDQMFRKKKIPTKQEAIDAKKGFDALRNKLKEKRGG